MYDEEAFSVRVDLESMDPKTYVSGPDSVVISAIIHHAVEDGLVSAHDVVDVLNRSWRAGREGDVEIGEGSTSNVISSDTTWIVAPFEVPHDIRTLGERDPDFTRDMAHAMKSAADLGAGTIADRPSGLLSQAASVGSFSGATSRGPVIEPVLDHAARSKDVGR